MMFRRQVQAFKDQFAPSLFARVEYAFHFEAGQPLNGQRGRQEIVTEIVGACSIEQIVETGTHRGASAEWFAQFHLPVYTVEIGNNFFEYSKLRLANFHNIKLFHTNSLRFLPEISKEISRSTTLFYLDAHWKEYLPLAEELGIIYKIAKDAVIVIDDFEVPDDQGYGFDDYGPGQALTLEYVSSAGLNGIEPFFPRMPSQQETGPRRGCVVLPVGAEMTAKLRHLKSLRGWNGAMTRQGTAASD